MSDWWKSGVIYHIYPRSFQDTTGNGIGDLPGIIARLDYLVDLGVDGLWISPFYPSPMADFGYDVADYTDVDPLFGDMEDFDELLAACHRRGLKMIIDIVPNHTSDQHPWFAESRSSRDNPKRDWYVWRDPKPDGSHPNNWLSAFGGPAWEWDERTGQFYLHSFLKEQADLNWRNPEVQEAMFDVYRFWLDRGVDGFRIDVAHRIMKDPEMRDNPPAVDTEDRPYKSQGAYDSQLHIHDMGHPDIHGVHRRLRRLVDAYQPPRVTMGEIHIFDVHEAVRYYGSRLDELHMPFNFNLLYAPWDAARVRSLIDEYEAALPEGAWPNYVLGNHDEPRLATRVGGERTRVAAMLLLTLRGTPTLYYGDELGLEEVSIPAEQQQDPWAIREPELGRDGSRTPMVWDSLPNGGFTRASPWLPLHDDLRSLSVAAQIDDPGSLLTLYRGLLALRHARTSLQLGSYVPLDGLPPTVFGFVRAFESERLIVLLNFAADPVELEDARFVALPVVLATHEDADGESLPGHAGVILEAGNSTL